MEQKNMEDIQFLIKIGLLILLSYIIPILGIGFSIFILTRSELRNYGKWVKMLAVISLLLQIVMILGIALGVAAWMLDPVDTINL